MSRWARAPTPSIPMLIAEELEVDLNQVRLEHAPPNEKLYGNPLLGGIQATGDSTAIRAAWQPMRRGRRDRENDARGGGGKALECRPGVLPRAKRRSAPSADGAKPQVRRACRRRRASGNPSTTWRSSGRRNSSSSARRQSVWTRRQKVNGTAVYGIDVRLPGVKIATLAQSPVFGGRVKSVDDARPRPSRACGRSCGSTTPSPSSPTIWGPRRRGWRPWRSNGTTDRTPSSIPKRSPANLKKRRSIPGAVAQNIGNVDEGAGGRRRQGRGESTRFRSSPTRRWSR